MSFNCSVRDFCAMVCIRPAMPRKIRPNIPLKRQNTPPRSARMNARMRKIAALNEGHCGTGGYAIPASVIRRFWAIFFLLFQALSWRNERSNKTAPRSIEPQHNSSPSLNRTSKSAMYKKPKGTTKRNTMPNNPIGVELGLSRKTISYA